LETRSQYRMVTNFGNKVLMEEGYKFGNKVTM